MRKKQKTKLKAVIFDLDGVIVDTAEYHYQSWKRLADELGIPFDRKANEKLKGVDRMNSLRAILGNRVADYSQTELIKLTERKNSYYLKLIQQVTGDDLLPGVKELLEELKHNGIKTAIASCSKNAPAIIRKLGIEDSLDVVVSGNDLTRSKPDPQIFNLSAKRLAVKSYECIVIEDAIAGLEAARAGGMITVGVGDPIILKSADLTVPSLELINFNILNKLLFWQITPDDTWKIVQENFSADKEAVQETIFTLANGYMGVRGTLNCRLKESRPSTYVGGIYTYREGRRYQTSYQNAPGWWEISVFAGDQEFNPEKCEVVDFQRVLDMKQGILFSLMRLKDRSGRITRIDTGRILSMADRHAGLVFGKIILENWGGKITIKSSLDARQCSLDPEQRKVCLKLNEIAGPDSAGGIYSEIKAPGTGSVIGQAISFQLTGGKNIYRSIKKGKEEISENFSFELKQGEPCFFEKYVAVFSNQTSPAGIRNKCKTKLARLKKKGASAIISAHTRQYKKLWSRSEVKITGDPAAQQALRFSIFHLLQCGDPKDEKKSIAAKGLHGEGYAGHIFWDTEIYILPFFLFSFPEIARNLLRYRYHTLGQARENARKINARGAKYPWESADTGREEVPCDCVFGDEQLHIGTDIVYAVDHYYRVTGDRDFMASCGVEMILEICRFFASILKLDQDRGKYVLNGVTGPDEYHSGVNNNFYTNSMVRWTLKTGIFYTGWLKKISATKYRALEKKLGLKISELEDWKKKIGSIFLPEKKNGIYEQHDDYFKLRNVTRQEYRDDVHISKTQLIKQADVVLLQFLLPEDFDLKTRIANYEYYEPRTHHGSSLSPAIYSIAATECSKPEKAYDYFMHSATLDLKNHHGNTHSGIHAAALGGTWQAAVFGFGGVKVINDELHFRPRLPDRWEKLGFRLKFQGRDIKVDLTPQKAVFLLKSGKNLTIFVHGKPVRLRRSRRNEVQTGTPFVFLPG